MNALGFLFDKRLRGFRVIELGGFACLTVLVLGVYFTKAHAGSETAKTSDVDQQIVETQHHVRLLDAEVAHLEAPSRIEQLSQQYLGLAPIAAKHETPDTGLMEIARQAADPPKAKLGAAKSAVSPAVAGKPPAAAAPAAPNPGVVKVKTTPSHTVSASAPL